MIARGGLAMLARLCAFVVLLLLGGCLEVDSMEITVVADAAADRLDVLIVSRGISSSGPTKPEGDLELLLKCRELAAVPVPGIGVMDFTQEDDESHNRELLSWLEIEAGAFFTDERGRLSYYQFARILHPARFAAEVERQMRAQFAAPDPKLSPATRALRERAVKEQWPLFAFAGAGCTLRWPLADDEHRQEMQHFWAQVFDGVRQDAKPEELRGMAQWLRDNDLAVVRRPGVTEFVIGTQGAEQCEFSLRGAEYTDNLHKLLVAKEPSPPKATQKLIDEQFDAFHRRATRMPKAFVEAKVKAGARK